MLMVDPLYRFHGETPMNFHALWTALAFTSLAATAAVGCTGQPPSPAQVYLDAVVSPSNDPAHLAECNVGSSTHWLLIGQDMGSGVPKTTEDGSNGVNVSCTVSQTGNDQYNVSLSAHLPGSAGGTFTVTSDSTMPVTSMGGMNLSVDEDTGEQGYGELHGTGCTLDYAGARPADGKPIQPGRIWAHVTCPAAVDIGTTKQLMDGGTADETCTTSATFLFQDCGQ
jgi:hypothetical protein